MPGKRPFKNSRRLGIWGIAATLFLSMSTATAESDSGADCLNQSEHNAYLLEYKNLFFSGDFLAFLEYADPFDQIEDSKTRETVRLIKAKIPNGFRQCVTIIQESPSENLIKDLSVFETPDGEFVFLLSHMVRYDGEFQVFFYQLDTSYEVLATNF